MILKRIKLLFVPGDWNTQRPQLYYYEGTVWYRKHFEYSLQPGKRLFLNFGAVNYEAIVWLNGKRLAGISVALLLLILKLPAF